MARGDWANMQRKGERNGAARLTREEVRGILMSLEAGSSVRGLARAHLVSRTAIYHVKNGRNWGWVAAS